MPALGNRVKRGNLSVEASSCSDRSGDQERVFRGCPCVRSRKFHLAIYPRKLSGCMSREKQRAVEKLFGSCGKPASGDCAGTGSRRLRAVVRVWKRAAESNGPFQLPLLSASLRVSVGLVDDFAIPVA